MPFSRKVKAFKYLEKNFVFFQQKNLRSSERELIKLFIYKMI